MSAVPTDDKVMGIGINMESRCRCCQTPAVESINHLFFKGDIAQSAWTYFKSMFGGGLIGEKESFTRVISAGRPKSFMSCLKIGVACCILWEIWKYRNSILYDQRSLLIRVCISKWGMDLAKLVPAKLVRDVGNASLKRVLPFSKARRRFSVGRWIPSPITPTDVRRS
ncbi:hypothetical protein QQ045_015586 [Rhodiola kirilowii]